MINSSVFFPVPPTAVASFFGPRLHIPPAPDTSDALAFPRLTLLLSASASSSAPPPVLLFREPVGFARFC